MRLRPGPALPVAEHVYVRSAADPYVCVGLPGARCFLPRHNRVHVDAVERGMDSRELAAGERVAA